MTSVAIGTQPSPTSVNPMPQLVLTKECDTAKGKPTNSGTSASQDMFDYGGLGNTVVQRASKFGEVHSAVAQSLDKPLKEASTSPKEDSFEPSTLPDRPSGTNIIKVNPPAAGPSNSVIPNKLGSIVQMSKEYGELHISSPTSAATPRGDNTTSPNTGGESFGARTFKKFKSLNSILSRRGSGGQADNTPRRTLSGPGRFSKGFRAFKDSTVRGLKRLASAGRVRSSNAENE
ncbi:hypothetical protein FGB62_2g43 [Gracilaria domingensis]|nr:hypothetical protein FGB62_2g43 [Gracilaria domingensis]